MANNFLTTKNIARQILPELIDNLVMPNLCYRDYSSTFATQGATIRVRKPTVMKANEFVAGQPVQAQDIVEDSVDVTLDKIATVDVNIEAIEMATSIEDLNRQVIRPAAIALAEKINKDGLAQYAFAGGTLGTAGTTPDGLDDFAEARKYLNAQRAPLSERRAVWDVEADAKFTQIGNLVKVNEAGTATALREGEIGRVFGIDNYMSQGIEKHTTHGAGTVLVDGAANAGATKIHVDGVTTALVEGDTFTINGDTTVYRVVGAGKLQTGDQDLEITPALAKNAADNAAITLGAAYVPNLVFHRNAIAFVTRPLVAPAGADSYTTSYNDISLRVVRDYDITTKREKLSVDILYGYKTVYPELSAVYMG